MPVIRTLIMKKYSHTRQRIIHTRNHPGAFGECQKLADTNEFNL